MRFKNWLVKTENASMKNRSGGNVDRTTNMGPASHFGGSRTLMPISLGIDNRAFAGVVDGIGSARSKVRDEMGAEPGAASTYEKLQDMKREAVFSFYMPLQLPIEYLGQSIYITKSLISKIKSEFGDPMENVKVYNVENDNKTMRQRSEEMGTMLYTFAKNNINPSELESAQNYTTAMMMASIQMKLSAKSNSLSIANPELVQRKSLPFRLDGSERFYKLMMCAFRIRPKDNDLAFGDSDEIDNIERILNREEELVKSKKKPVKNNNRKRPEGSSHLPTRQVPPPKSN